MYCFIPSSILNSIVGRKLTNKPIFLFSFNILLKTPLITGFISVSSSLKHILFDIPSDMLLTNSLFSTSSSPNAFEREISDVNNISVIFSVISFLVSSFIILPTISSDVKSWLLTAFPTDSAILPWFFGMIPGVNGNLNLPIFICLYGWKSIFIAIKFVKYPITPPITIGIIIFKTSIFFSTPDYFIVLLYIYRNQLSTKNTALMNFVSIRAVKNFFIIL